MLEMKGLNLFPNPLCVDPKVCKSRGRANKGPVFVPYACLSRLSRFITSKL